MFSPTDLKAVRLRLGFRSRRALAEALGVSTRAIDSWEQGWRPVPGWMEKFLTCIKITKQAPEEP